MINITGYANLLFDLGGVLYALDYSKTQAAFAALAAQGGGELTYGKAKQDPIFDAFESGKASPEEFLARLGELLNLPATTETEAALSAAWNAILLGPMPGRAELLARLKTRHRLALLSNTNDIHWAVVRPQIEVFAPHFEQIFASNEVGLRKPDAPFYHHALNALGWQASETLFIDDIESNVEGARAAGLAAYHLTDPEELMAL
jgi:HAD superfamily hydrolase (TIGR01509 family)